MTWLQEIEKTGIAVRQHHDDDYDLELRKVTFSCRLGKDPGTGRELVEVRSQGDDMGHNLWRAVPSQRACSAWNPAWSVIVSYAEADTRGAETTATRRTGAANGASLGLPALAVGMPDQRFHTKQLNREEWHSKFPVGWTGTIGSGTNERAQENIWHPDFLGLVSASRGAPEFSTTVVDMDPANPTTVDASTAAPFHTFGVTDEIAAGGGAAPLPGNYVALNMHHDPELGGGGLVGYRDDGRGLRALLTLSSRYNGPMVLPNRDSHNANRYRIGATADGHPVMPMAFTTGALWRGGQGGQGPNFTGPLQGWTDELSSPHNPCSIMWQGTHWRIYSPQAIVEVPTISHGGGDHPFDDGTGGVIDTQDEFREWEALGRPGGIPFGGGFGPGGGGGGGGGGAGGFQAPLPWTPEGGGGGGGGGGGADPNFDPNAAAGAGGGNTGRERNGDGPVGTPFGLNSGQRSGGESQAEVNARFGGMGFGIPSSGQASRRNRRRSPGGGFGIPGAGGGPGAGGQGRRPAEPVGAGPGGGPADPAPVDPQDAGAAADYGRSGRPTREDIDAGRATRGGRWIWRRPKGNSQDRKDRDAGRKDRGRGETQAGVNKRFQIRFGLPLPPSTGIGSAQGPLGNGTGGVFLPPVPGLGGFLGAGALRIGQGGDLNPDAFIATGVGGILVGSGATPRTRQIAVNTIGVTGLDIIAQPTNAGEASTRGTPDAALLGAVRDAPVAATLVGYASGSGSWGGFEYGTPACPTVSGRTRGGQQGQPVALDGGTVFLPPGATLDQISGGETLESVSGNPVYCLFPQDVSAIAFGSLAIGEDTLPTDAVGGIVSGTRIYQGSGGLFIEPITSTGTVNPIHFGFTETGLTIYGGSASDCVFTLDGLIDPSGIVFSEQGSDPMTGTQVGLYAGDTAGANEPWWRRDDGTVVNLLTGGGNITAIDTYAAAGAAANHTFTIPAATLANNGEWLEWEGGCVSASGGGGTVTLHLNGVLIHTVATAVSQSAVFTLKIVRTSTTAGIFTLKVSDAGTTSDALIFGVTATWSGTVAILVTAASNGTNFIGVMKKGVDA